MQARNWFGVVKHAKIVNHASMELICLVPLTLCVELSEQKA